MPDRPSVPDAESIAWLEEPIRHDDYAGAALLARELKTPPLAIADGHAAVSQWPGPGMVGTRPRSWVSGSCNGTRANSLAKYPAHMVKVKYACLPCLVKKVLKVALKAIHAGKIAVAENKKLIRRFRGACVAEA